MKLTLIKSNIAVSAFVQKSIRKDGKSTTVTIEKLGTLDEIKAKYGCADPLEWAKKHVQELTANEKLENKKLRIELSPTKRIDSDSKSLMHGGDLFVLPIYQKLGIEDICNNLIESCRVKYNLNEIMQTLVISRVLFPCSKASTYDLARNFINLPKFAMEDMYRSLSLISKDIDYIQAQVYKNSKKFMTRKTGVIFYDCTNYFFETEKDDEDIDGVNGLRKHGKSKENRPNPIVQMGMFMDYDGIPLAFCINPGNTNEQTTMKPVEEILAEKFDLTKFVVSTDAGLGCESNRRYNMTEGREYITVQSIKQLKASDQEIVLNPNGWRIHFRESSLSPINANDHAQDVFNISEIDMGKEHNTIFYKEVLLEKADNRMERVIVTYSEKYAEYERKNRAENILRAERMIKKGSVKSRQTQQDARRLIATAHSTEDGEIADKTSMSLNTDTIAYEERFDGFYAYATSLDDDVADILKVRHFH